MIMMIISITEHFFAVLFFTQLHKWIITYSIFILPKHNWFLKYWVMSIWPAILKLPHVLNARWQLVQIGWKKRGKGGGKHIPVYKMIYWEGKYMDYTFHEISSVDKIQVHIIIIESSCRINIQDSYRILSTIINWWYFQDITCIWSPISSRRRRRL